MAEWEKQIDGVIGDGEKPFSGNPCDSKSARKMMNDAIEEGEGFDGYCTKLIDAYREKLPDTPEGNQKFADQMLRIQRLDSYFDRD